MKINLTILLAGMLVSGVILATKTLRAETTRPASALGPRFTTVDVYIDSKDQPLAAYQCEITAKGADVKVVGVEGNAKVPAFAEPPYYDPKALLEDRLILAAFCTRKDLPKGRTRVGTIHVQVTGARQPEFAIKLETAADADGKPIPATITLVQGDHM